jgi:isopentenyl diphosphate isomerase/L-lactate dehydrogenase-like FMN-dependent dehydrogenase
VNTVVPGMDTHSIKNLSDLAVHARRGARGAVWDFLEGGAGTERTVAANVEEFNRWVFRPRILTGSQPPSLETTYLGWSLRMPVATAPFGADGLFHPDGQLAVAAAAQDVGALAIAPHVSTHSLERIREAAPEAALMFQLHPVGSLKNFRRLVKRAENAGYRGLVITADCPTAGYRDRVLANQFVYEDVMRGNYEGADEYAEEMFGEFRTMSQPLWTFDYLAEALSETSLPVVIKGVMTAEDAELSAKMGAAGVIVSNHGGRQLDCAPAALRQLPEVVEAVGGRISVALDGGIRRGTDVLKALALGADLVVVGRLAAMGLCAGGRAGVRRALEMLAAEMIKSLALLGRSGVTDIDRSMVMPA